MASGIVKDIDERFCQCSICLEQFKEPKQLPCLHRFCKDCLAEVIKQTRESLACPVCREECIVPKEGLDGFKTDFYMKNIIEYIQLHNSLKSALVQECYGCSKTVKVSAYCYKCNDFLCEACHQFHVTSKITKDHRPHTLAVEDMASKSLTLEKLASLKEAPRCCTHSEKLSELCCKSCRNTPICMACTYGNHKGHDFYEVTALAVEEKEKLKQKLENLLSYEKEIFKRPDNLGKIKIKIKEEATEKKEYVLSMYTDESSKLEEKLQHLQKKNELEKIKKEKELKKELAALQTEMENEIHQIRVKFNKLCHKKKDKTKIELEMIQSECNKQSSSLQKKLSACDTVLKEATASLAKQEQDNIHKVQEILDHFDNTFKRFENLKATASNIIESKNDWTAVQCIPDICTAIQPLIEDMRRDFPELDTLTEINLNPLPSMLSEGRLSISDQTLVVNIDQIAAKGWSICDVRVSHSGSIVITGNADVSHSHITVIDEEGKVIRQWIKKNMSIRFPRSDRFCDLLSEEKIATTCDPNEIGVFDIRDGSYIKKNISDCTFNWPTERGVTCIACDTVNNQIIVGSWEGPELCIFDEGINYVRTLMLPESLIGADGIIISSTNLLVCGFRARKAIAMSMDESDGEIVFEFSKPFDDGRHWHPINFCKDSRGFIYILWTDEFWKGSGDHVIAQYGENDTNVLTTKWVDYNAISLQTVKVNHTERLLVATQSSGKMFQYDLVSQL